jgi:lipid A 3-O-deacylase
MEKKNVFRCVVAVFFILITSGIAQAQINPQNQIATPALSSSDSTPVAPTTLQSIDDEIGQSTAAQQSQPAAQSQPRSQAPVSEWPEGAPTTDAHGNPYKHVSQVYYHEWSWESGVYAGGGTGLGTSDATQFLVVGLHVGKVLTGDHFRGIIHGNFEFGGEFLPVYELFTRNPQDVNQNVYGVSIKPVILRWNLMSWNKVVPFVQLAGGFLITNSPVPPGHTSAFNFTPQGGWGFNVFTKPGQAVKTEFIFGHISNANLGIRNPGYNSLFLFEIGYEWLHGWRHH